MKTLRSGRRPWRRLVKPLIPGLIAVAALVVAVGPAVSSASPPPPNPVPGGSLDPTTIPKYKEPLVIPPAMPRTQVINAKGKQIDYYEIAVKQFEQYILPKAWSDANDMDPTTVWSYASMLDPRPVAEGGTLNYPGLTIEAQKDRPVRVKWINGLVDENGHYLPHLFAVDQTLHWANPSGGPGGTDTHGMDAEP
jgi:spore coat protein A, manganese oxidase